jgi:Lon protease-like protein
MDVVTRGQRRFEILELNQEKAFLQAEVRFFDDDDIAAVPAELREAALAHYRALEGLRAGGGEPDLNDPQLSFQLAQSLPDLNFLNALLQHRSESERLRQLNRYLAEYLPRQRDIERVRGLAPTNGFGGKLAGL